MITIHEIEEENSSQQSDDILSLVSDDSFGIPVHVKSQRHSMPTVGLNVERAVTPVLTMMQCLIQAPSVFKYYSWRMYQSQLIENLENEAMNNFSELLRSLMNENSDEAETKDLLVKLYELLGMPKDPQEALTSLLSKIELNFIPMIAKNQETDIPLDERISLFKKGNYSLLSKTFNMLLKQTETC